MTLQQELTYLIHTNDPVQDFKDRLVIELADQIDHLQSHSSGDYTEKYVLMILIPK